MSRRDNSKPPTQPSTKIVKKDDHALSSSADFDPADTEHRDSVRSRSVPNLLLVGREVLVDWSIPFVFIFGGCCSNMFTLESIVKYEADSGLIITLVQILFTASITAWPQIAFSKNMPWVLRRPQLPFRNLLISAAFFWIVNMMNNWAFGFKISVPVHIILRSGGSVMSMAVGLMHGRRYTRSQFAGVFLLTAGVVTAAMADAQAKGRSSTTSSGDTKSFLQGLALLFIAQLLSAEMGVYTESMYNSHGRHWEENLLWSHIFASLFFVTVQPQLGAQLSRLLASPSFIWPCPKIFSEDGVLEIPQQVVYLALNSLTQFFCIQGVSRLAARVSPLGVTIVLNIRKLISLLLSIWMFGNVLPPGVWIGAMLVFLGGGVYVGWSQGRMASKNKRNKAL